MKFFLYHSFKQNLKELRFSGFVFNIPPAQAM